ncbi:protein BIG GRAIN 1-like B [Helianthus annuus]|uniref:protein BIG GRAIN 1-like B n=1 Tax=Helianthus annuus TaxID=4232 RepID=UPI001652F396|nr:protein BIG GRAIN 1-like B [Helianthus annuus]
MESASRRYPSFSSTLLDEIYRSIDEEEEESIPSGTKSRNACFEDDDERRRACLVQEWIENKAAAASTARGSLNLNIKPKPIRTCVYQHDKQRIVYGQAADSQAKSKFTKTKSKALKILKHPISPGENLFKNYQNKVEKESDDDGSSSDSSSDLFELHNISAHMYRDELPVYETTQLDTKPLFI